MPKYYIKYDTSNAQGHVFWFGPNNQWVEQQCNAVAYNTIESAKADLASFVNSDTSSQYSIVEEKVTFDVVFRGHQLIYVRLNKLADMALFGYSADHIAEEIRKIAKEIKQ